MSLFWKKCKTLKNFWKLPDLHTRGSQGASGTRPREEGGSFSLSFSHLFKCLQSVLPQLRLPPRRVREGEVLACTSICRVRCPPPLYLTPSSATALPCYFGSLLYSQPSLFTNFVKRIPPKDFYILSLPSCYASTHWIRVRALNNLLKMTNQQARDVPILEKT